ncbi:MAG: hypothetical protein ACRC62_33375, partial [Microcoleus sp.]
MQLYLAARLIRVYLAIVVGIYHLIELDIVRSGTEIPFRIARVGSTANHIRPIVALINENGYWVGCSTSIRAIKPLNGIGKSRVVEENTWVRLADLIFVGTVLDDSALRSIELAEVRGRTLDVLVASHACRC